MSDDELPASPDFHACMTFGIVMKTLSRFEFALGRRVKWRFHSHQLQVSPHAVEEANAFYSHAAQGLCFGYFPTWLSSPQSAEEHDCGEVLVAAVLNAFVAVSVSRLEALGSESRLDRARAAEEGAELADHLLNAPMNTATSNTTSASRFWMSSGRALVWTTYGNEVRSIAALPRTNRRTDPPAAVRWFINQSRELHDQSRELHDEDSGRGQR